jgi:hypothetical protein
MQNSTGRSLHLTLGSSLLSVLSSSSFFVPAPTAEWLRNGEPKACEQELKTNLVDKSQNEIAPPIPADLPIRRPRPCHGAGGSNHHHIQYGKWNKTSTFSTEQPKFSRDSESASAGFVLWLSGFGSSRMAFASTLSLGMGQKNRSGPNMDGFIYK